MDVAAFDLETLRILPGCAAPPIVCGSWCEGDREGLALDVHDRARVLLLAAGAGREIVALANAPFDLACLANEHVDLRRPIFDARRVALSV